LAARLSKRPEYAVIAQLITEARDRAGLSQSELARRLGRRQAYIWKLENAVQRPDLVELLDIAAILQMDLPDMIRRVQKRSARLNALNN
jgi:transcriptional regulator with XRE-family HTH domain